MRPIQRKALRTTYSVFCFQTILPRGPHQSLTVCLIKTQQRLGRFRVVQRVTPSFSLFPRAASTLAGPSLPIDACLDHQPPKLQTTGSLGCGEGRPIWQSLTDFAIRTSAGCSCCGPSAVNGQSLDTTLQPAFPAGVEASLAARQGVQSPDSRTGIHPFLSPSSRSFLESWGSGPVAHQHSNHACTRFSRHPKIRQPDSRWLPLLGGALIRSADAQHVSQSGRLKSYNAALCCELSGTNQQGPVLCGTISARISRLLVQFLAHLEYLRHLFPSTPIQPVHLQSLYTPSSFLTPSYLDSTMKFLSLAILSLVGLVAAQDLSGLPTCAYNCALQGIGGTGCAVTDSKCICAASSFLSSVQSCIEAPGGCNASDVQGKNALRHPNYVPSPMRPSKSYPLTLPPFHSNAPVRQHLLRRQYRLQRHRQWHVERDVLRYGLSQRHVDDRQLDDERVLVRNHRRRQQRGLVRERVVGFWIVSFSCV